MSRYFHLMYKLIGILGYGKEGSNPLTIGQTKLDEQLFLQSYVHCVGHVPFIYQMYLLHTFKQYHQQDLIEGAKFPKSLPLPCCSLSLCHCNLLFTLCVFYTTYMNTTFSRLPNQAATILQYFFCLDSIPFLNKQHFM